MSEHSKLQSEITDEELIRRFQEDDFSAYTVIVNRYKDQLLNFAYRFLGSFEEAEDIVQETFLRLYRNKHAYRQIAKFSTWIYTIAGNLAKTELRKRKRRKVMSISDMGYEDRELEIRDEGANTEQVANSALTEKIIQRAIDELPSRFKEVIILRDIQELSYEEVGSILKIPLGTVKSRVNRARLKLQSKLRDIKMPSL
ncbi:sigma-70 family RNA polymerase sigma factor [candidate division KSB1 bacterium]|nr:sigma-70 family RNA polymerase sigma factor [candidate division KSB1 bacterium]RQW11473.1 MAG: sigma-70 family RNA polymerase sigma factor [candidate division KSB1 bacterium]